MLLRFGNKLIGIYGIILSWIDGLAGIFYNVFLLSKASSTNALAAYLGTLYPTGMVFKEEVLRHAVGYKLLTEKQCRIAQKLTDMEYLRSLPDGSLGKHYYDFITNEVNAKLSDNFENYHTLTRNYFFSHKERYKRRLIKKLYKDDIRTTIRLTEQIAFQHDLIHVIAGYKADEYGEIGVHAFQLSYLKIPAVKLIAILGTMSQTVRTFNSKALSIALEAYSLGKNTNQSLFVVDWADHLSDQITDIKKKYGINENEYYKKINSKRRV